MGQITRLTSQRVRLPRPPPPRSAIPSADRRSLCGQSKSAVRQMHCPERPSGAAVPGGELLAMRPVYILR